MFKDRAFGENVKILRLEEFEVSKYVSKEGLAAYRTTRKMTFYGIYLAAL